MSSSTPTDTSAVRNPSKDGVRVATKKKKKKTKKAKPAYPAAWRWLESLTPLLRVRALATRDEVATTVIINLANDQNHSSVTQRIMDIESFRLFTKEVGTNIVGSKRMRSTKKGKCYYVRNQHRQFNVKMKVDPKVMHRSLAFHNSGSAKAVKEVKLRKQSVEALSVMPWEEGRAQGGGGFGGGSNGRNGKGGSDKELANMVNAVTASFAAVGKLDRLWTRLREFSDGRFLENPEEELAGLRTETNWYTKWFRDLPRFSFQQLVAALLEFALLRSFDKWCKKNTVDAGEVKGVLLVVADPIGRPTLHSTQATLPPGFEAKALSDGTSPLLEKVRRLADYWSSVSLDARIKHLKDAHNKVGNSYLSKGASGAKGSERKHGGGGAAAGKSSKRPPSHDEKRKNLEFFLTRRSLVEKESDTWTLDRYMAFFWDLMATPLPDCSLPEHTLTCRKAIIYEIDVKRSEAQTKNLLIFMSGDGTSNNSKANKSKNKNKNKKKKSKKNKSKETAAQGGLGVSGKKDQDDDENADTSSKAATASTSGTASDSDAPDSEDTREETAQEKKTRKAREKRKRQKEKKARREAERKREEAERQAVEDARKEIKHREKMVRRCVQQLIRDVEVLREEQIKEEKKRRHRENERRKREKKEAAARERKEREAIEIMCQQVLVGEIISGRVFKKIAVLEENRRPVHYQYEEERRRRVTEEEDQLRKTRNERKFNQERAARDLDAEKARRVAEWENVTHVRHWAASRIAQQELAAQMSELERERRMREHDDATRTSLVERDRNAVKANEMMDQEQLRLISDYREAQEKRRVEEKRKKLLKLLKEGVTHGAGSARGYSFRGGGVSVSGSGGSLRNLSGLSVAGLPPSTSAGKRKTPRSASSTMAGGNAGAAAPREKNEKRWQGWSVEANDKKVQELNRKARKERASCLTPPRSSSAPSSSSSQSSPHGGNVLSPSGGEHVTHSKDNREGMYRRGVVRTLAVSAAIETLEKIAKITRVGRSLVQGDEAPLVGSRARTSPAMTLKQGASATSSPSLPPSTIPQLSDLVDQWPEASCVVYGARAINSYIDGGASPRRLHTEDLDVQVFLGKDATPEHFFEFCRKLAVNMTWQLEGHTQRLRKEWAAQAKQVENALKGNGRGKSKEKVNERDGSVSAIVPQNKSLSPSQRRELEIEYEVAIDRGQSFGSFPWWRGQTTSFTMQTPSSVTYPGDDLPGAVVHASLPEGNFAQYRSVLQPHDVTHAKWAVLGPVVDFTWLKIAPSLNTVEMRPLSALRPRVDRAAPLEEAIFCVPTRSLRWLDRANLSTLRGKSLENEWRRSKDAHRRQYMAGLQRRGCLVAVGSGGAMNDAVELEEEEVDNEEEEEETKDAPRVVGKKVSLFAADWTEFPGGADGARQQESIAEMTREELAAEVRKLRAQLLL